MCCPSLTIAFHFCFSAQMQWNNFDLFTCTCKGVCRLEPRYRLPDGQCFIVARDFSAHTTAISKRTLLFYVMCNTGRYTVQLRYQGVVKKYHAVQESGRSSNPDANFSLFELALCPFWLNLRPDPSLWCCVFGMLAIGHVISPREV